ncbi:hypothetical protein N658DRAFT_502090 [Parathielavia hyrcaniae]|uniref:Glycine-rich domain-containing protein 1 n=1 Tax=Parathielavia hyrcaniae TaxID=113614 RepID=A0AAN6PUR0_9PEZI|nr:hypothetical protein N658DRAFT_502090 [Parathielavia hyrcaniae]
MALDCPEHKQTLHGVGHSALSSNGLYMYSGVHAPRFKPACSPSEEPSIPSLALFRDFRNSKHEAGQVRLPTASECAAHLELLETFYVLRQKVLRSKGIDDAMGVVPARETKTGVKKDTKVLKDAKLWEKRQVKWPAFVEFAVVRFLAWRRALQTRPENQHGSAAPGPSTTGVPYLPPVDVLMVWHALMLNPHLFRSSFHEESLYKMAMPWTKVHQLIDNKTWTLNLPIAARASFERDTALPDDLFNFLETWPPVEDGGLGCYSLLAAAAVPSAPRATTLSLAAAKAPNDAMLPNAKYPDIQKYIASFCRESQDPLAVQLRDAVIRQASFVDKMNKHLWIRSPFVSDTLRRAIVRYERFLELMRLNPGNMLVPTLDIDLVWHTHQCQAHMYARGTREMVGRFVNHDDSIAQDTLKGGSTTTSDLWRTRYGTEYRACGCWDCEGLVSLLEKSGEVREDTEMDEIAKKVARTVIYYRAVETARRKGVNLPKYPMEFA